MHRQLAPCFPSILGLRQPAVEQQAACRAVMPGAIYLSGLGLATGKAAAVMEFRAVLTSACFRQRLVPSSMATPRVC